MFAALQTFLIACYDDSDETQTKAVDFLQGKFKAKGVLPVRVCIN